MSNTKTVYCYDANMLYSGARTLDDSDMDIFGNWNIPANCTELAPLAEKTGYDIIWNGTAWEYSEKVTDKICYYDYGIKYKTVDSTYTAQAGEVLFDSTPTTDQLKAAFPSTAASKTYTITKNAAADDTVTFDSITLTAGTDFALGTDETITAANIAAALNSKEIFSANYTAVVSAAVITIKENCCGIGNNPPDMTTTGTLTIENGTLTASVYGYISQIKHDKKIAAENEAKSIIDEYRNNYLQAFVNGDTALCTNIKADIDSIKSQLYTRKKEIDNE